MKANKIFLNQPKSFWANVRTISQHLGYTLRGKNQIKIPTILEMSSTMKALGLNSNHLMMNDQPTVFGKLLAGYFNYRADILNNFVESKLMDVEKARLNFELLKSKKTTARGGGFIFCALEGALLPFTPHPP